ncbi:monocarboxylate transporter 2 isoform X2 [Rhipicephalus sanguineus]|uniref:monocarboxylate transporter 2 isoform X2 n=1 Tax=Rhipicephalus sanguineus TaxID=34632 RepID=UPI001895F97D|nr:monocarboxylate transporter 2 isoform X2 [Rhipicephalus sanguineus]
MPGRRTWYLWNCCHRVPQHGPDSVHSWLVDGACALSSFFALAAWRSMGLLFVAMLETFHASRVEASWPIVVLGALGYMAAIGTGMVYIVAPTILSEHFVTNKGLAMGINYAGVTAALFVFPKLLEYLIAGYGLRGALLICGAVTMNGFAFSLFIRTPGWCKVAAEENEDFGDFPPKTIEVERSKKLRHAFAVFKSPMFYLIMYSFNAYSMSYDFYMSLFVDFACDRGVLVSTAVTVMAAGAVSEGLGRFMLPIAVDRNLLTSNVALTITLGVEAAAFLLLPFVHIHGFIFAVAAGIGFVIGTGIVIFPVTLEHYFGHRKMSVAFGIVVASAGFQSFLRPSLIGHFRDKGGAYDWLFVICGVVNVVSVAIWIGVLVWECCAKHRNVVVVENTPTGGVIKLQHLNKAQGPQPV